MNLWGSFLILFQICHWLKRAQCVKVPLLPHHWLCSSLSLPRLGNPEWIVCVTTTWMGCQGPSPLALSLVLGQSQLQSVRQGSQLPNIPGLNWETNTPSAFWWCNERSVPDDVHSPTMWTMQRGQRHDIDPLFSHPGVPWSYSGVRSWNFSGDRAVPALPIHTSCPASVLGSICLHHSLKHQCMRSCKMCQLWMKVVWCMCFSY
jgi:hypothetical protein